MSGEEGGNPQQQWADALAERIEAATDGRIRLAVHVLARMAVLLYPAQPRHVDVNLASSERMLVSGVVRVWTDDHLLLADLQDVKTARHHRFDDGHREARVSIKVLPRSALQQVSIEPEGDSWVNGADVWQASAAEGNWTFPHYGRVTLRYAGLAEPVALPAGVSPGGIGELLPTLLGDLSPSCRGAE
ncbi:hypothetical protein E9549_04575 [Blastococcus sp. MG754426]|uniref:hypothetical protein n=1 Tax=unclassified Blastococcus TaxID=2619396 RepID=UPI0010739A45|nr:MULTISPECIES: hypothetical protein [unclassified Blastococcus]MCF6506681.1 hypothetical protein [Blastococcus sp. MG754426]MCF6511493.1 hypothetical protein [Blastococcus sp. MG754427]